MAVSPDVQEIIERLRAAEYSQKLEAMIDAHPAEVHVYQPGPNEWSFVKMMQHLGDIEEMRHVRFSRMLNEDNPVLDVVPPTPGERDTDDIHALLNRWRKLRQKSIDMLMPLTDEQWRRGGVQNPDPQVNRTQPAPTTVLREAYKIDLHAMNHLKQMQDNVDSYNKSK